MSKKLNTMQKAVAKPVVFILSLVLVATFIFIPTLVTADESTIPAEIADKTEAATPDAAGEEVADPDGIQNAENAESEDATDENAATDTAIDTRSAAINPLAAVSPTAAIDIPRDIKKGSSADTGGKTISELVLENSIITFAGISWLVIGKKDGDDETGVGTSDTPANSVTVVAANTGEDTFGTGRFHSRSSNYSGSTLQATMDSIYNGFSETDKSAVNLRPLDGISGSAVSAYVWPLSIDEYLALSKGAPRMYGASRYYWLRSARANNSSYIGYRDNIANYGIDFVTYVNAVRPASNLNPASGIFKSDAAAGFGFLAASVATDLTKTGLVAMDDEDTTLPAITVSGAPIITTAGGIRTIDLTVSDSAFTRAPNADEYIGVRLVNTTDKTKIYYARVTPAAVTNWNTTVSIPLNQVAGGTYDIYVCAERATADTALDIAGSISTYSTVYIPGIDAGITHVAGNAVTWSGDGTSTAALKTAAVAVESTMSEITAGAFTKSNPYATLTLCTDSGFTNEASSIPLAAGSNEVYVKVVAEDGVTTLYYKVAVDRKVSYTVTANGTDEQITTTALTITFTPTVSGLTAGSITLSPGSGPAGGSATAGTLSGTGPTKVWTLDLSSVTSPGSMNVSIAAFNGYTVENSPQPVIVHQKAVRIVTASAVTFGNVTGAAYTQPAAQSITIRNTGNRATTISAVTVSAITKFAITAGTTTVGANSTNTSWKIQPNEGIAPGIHTANIIVTYTSTDGSNIDDNATAAALVSFTIVRDAPNVTATNESISGKNDGKITGTDTTMEYGIGGNPDLWTTCPSTEITGLTPGAYSVRYKVVGGVHPVSAATTVTVDDGAAQTLTVTVTPPTFAAVTYGYRQPAAKDILIRNTGNWDATITSVTLGGASPGAFILTADGTDVLHSAFILSEGGTDVLPTAGLNASWKIRPAANLHVGTYTASITVNYAGIAGYTGGTPAPVTTDVTITVKSPEDDGGDDTNTNPNGNDPSKSGSKSDSSDTSDDSDIGLFSGTLILAAAGLIACVTARRRLGKQA